MMPCHFSSIAGYRFVALQVAALTSISRRPWGEDVCFALAGPVVPLFTAHTEAASFTPRPGVLAALVCSSWPPI